MTLTAPEMQVEYELDPKTKLPKFVTLAARNSEEAKSLNAIMAASSSRKTVFVMNAEKEGDLLSIDFVDEPPDDDSDDSGRSSAQYDDKSEFPRVTFTAETPEQGKLIEAVLAASSTKTSQFVLDEDEKLVSIQFVED